MGRSPGDDGPAPGLSERPVKRSVTVAGHRTSVSLEPAFWDALGRIAAERRISLNRLVEEIDASRRSNLSSALRVYVLTSLAG